MPGKGAFKRCVEDVTAKGGAYDPGAVCAAAGRKKYGAKKFAAMARAGRAAHARGNPKSQQTWTIYAGDSPADSYAGPYTSYVKARATLRWMKRHLFSPEGPSFFYLVKSKGKNPRGMTANEKAMLAAGKKLALAKVAPVALMAKNPQRKRNPEDTAAARFQDFHGEPAKEVIEWSEDYRYHGVTSDIGKLVSLLVSLPRSRGGGVVEIAGMKGARLTMNEAGTQLFVEGGDQSLDLAQFGVKTEHDREYLGELAKVTYHTNKTHLGKDGGNADYVHTFGRMESSGKKTERPQVFYDVLNEEILIAGGGYEIPSEGIDG